MRYLAIIVVSIVSLLMQPLFAANRSGALIITPSVGYYRYAPKRHIEDQVMPGISVGYGLSDQWSAALFLARISTDQDRGTKAGISGDLYSVNGFYHFSPCSPWQPYLLAGVGAMHLTPAALGEADTQANINAGAGLEYFFSDQISLRGDIRDFYTMVGGKHDFLANFSVSIYLFGKAPGKTAS